MRINANGLGYREVYRLAEFMKRIADKGIENDVAEEFGYDMYRDDPYCKTADGNKIWDGEE